METHKIDIKFIDNFLTYEECKYIKTKFFELEDYIIENFSTKNNYHNLTSTFEKFNWLDELPFLVDKLSTLFDEPTYVQCWGNILRPNQGIPCHAHTNTGVHFPVGNIFIWGDEKTGTMYGDKVIKNKIGQLALFSSTMPHSVPINNTKIPRLSLAFDAYPENMSNKLLRKIKAQGGQHEWVDEKERETNNTENSKTVGKYLAKHKFATAKKLK